MNWEFKSQYNIGDMVIYKIGYDSWIRIGSIKDITLEEENKEFLIFYSIEEDKMVYGLGRAYVKEKDIIGVINDKDIIKKINEIRHKDKE